jgi:hypothetical protein
MPVLVGAPACVSLVVPCDIKIPSGPTVSKPTFTVMYFMAGVFKSLALLIIDTHVNIFIHVAILTDGSKGVPYAVSTL